MERFCRGDESAFETLYARHAPPTMAFLTRMVRDQALAEDLLQTTFLSVVRARRRRSASRPALAAIANTHERTAVPG